MGEIHFFGLDAVNQDVFWDQSEFGFVACAGGNALITEYDGKTTLYISARHFNFNFTRRIRFKSPETEITDLLRQEIVSRMPDRIIVPVGFDYNINLVNNHQTLVIWETNEIRQQGITRLYRVTFFDGHNFSGMRADVRERKSILFHNRILPNINRVLNVRGTGTIFYFDGPIEIENGCVVPLLNLIELILLGRKNKKTFTLRRNSAKLYNFLRKIIWRLWRADVLVGALVRYEDAVRLIANGQRVPLP